MGLEHVFFGESLHPLRLGRDLLILSRRRLRILCDVRRADLGALRRFSWRQCSRSSASVSTRMASGTLSALPCHPLSDLKHFESNSCGGVVPGGWRFRNHLLPRKSGVGQTAGGISPGELRVTAYVSFHKR